MCGTSRDCGKLCLWLTPASMVLMLATMGFCMFGSCAYGWYFSRKAEDDFIPWTCRVEEVWKLTGDHYEMEGYNSFPYGFSDDDYYRMPNDGYLRRESFMTRYNVSDNEYICFLYGYNTTTYTVEECKTIVWDADKMKKFFTIMVMTGFLLGLAGLLCFLCFWAMDKRGEVMHVKVKQIFFWLLFSTGFFVSGICGLAIDLYPYDNVAKSFGVSLLVISLFYPFFCLWATCKVVKEVGIAPPTSNQDGAVHNVPGELEPEGYTVAVRRGEGETEVTTY